MGGLTAPPRGRLAPALRGDVPRGDLPSPYTRHLVIRGIAVVNETVNVRDSGVFKHFGRPLETTVQGVRRY